MFMSFQTLTRNDFDARSTHELRFDSLYQTGKAIAVPCDSTGKVDLDALSDRLLNTYLGARAMLGREYAYPVVQRTH